MSGVRRMVCLIPILLITGGAIALWVTYIRLGYTPGELMDYSEKRLKGHPKIEFIALPIIAELREKLNAPSPEQRHSRLFLVPRPPPQKTTEKNTGSSGDSGRQPIRVIRAGKIETTRTIAEAARIALDGDLVEIEAGEYHGDVALWKQKNLTIRGIGGNARLFADGASAEGKAIWVIRDGNFVIENVDFIGARVHDSNGAGIRFENGRLKIKNCLFWANQNGLLTTGGEDQREARIEIEASEFGYNGSGDGLSHNLYVGKIAFLRVTGSYFHHANVGHLLKSRAAENEILYNRLTDESGGRASYEIDLPNGGLATVMGNIIQQNPETENSTMISYGRESYAWKENRLFLASNTIVNDHPYGGAFLRVATGAIQIVSANNLLIGKGRYHTPAVLESKNDIEANWDVFDQASRYDYHLATKGQRLKYETLELNDIPLIKLTPKRMYSHPNGNIAIVGAPRYAGALQ